MLLTATQTTKMQLNSYFVDFNDWFKVENFKWKNLYKKSEYTDEKCKYLTLFDSFRYLTNLFIFINRKLLFWISSFYFVHEFLHSFLAYTMHMFQHTLNQSMNFPSFITYHILFSIFYPCFWYTNFIIFYSRNGSFGALCLWVVDCNSG